MTQYDIHIQPVPVNEVVGRKCFEFGFAAAVKVEGLQSLINRWVKTLMTPRGSDPLDREAGTAFPNLVGGNISTVTTGIQDLVGASIGDANDQVRQQDIEGFRSDTEKLLSADLVDFRRGATGFDVWVKISNVAGTQVTFRLVTV